MCVCVRACMRACVCIVDVCVVCMCVPTCMHCVHLRVCMRCVRVWLASYMCVQGKPDEIHFCIFAY